MKEDIQIIGHNDFMGVYKLGDVAGPDDLTHEGFIKYEIEAGKESAMRYSLVAMQLKYIMGEVLTTLEAVIPDERQLKATKSIIKSQFGRKLDWVYTQCGSPEDEGVFVGVDDLPEVA